jgi:hypothetical protein
VAFTVLQSALFPFPLVSISAHFVCLLVSCSAYLQPCLLVFSCSCIFPVCWCPLVLVSSLICSASPLIYPCTHTELQVCLVCFRFELLCRIRIAHNFGSLEGRRQLVQSRLLAFYVLMQSNPLPGMESPSSTSCKATNMLLLTVLFNGVGPDETCSSDLMPVQGVKQARSY